MSKRLRNEKGQFATSDPRAENGRVEYHGRNATSQKQAKAEGIGQEQPRRRRANPRRDYPEVDALVDDYGQISALAPEEIRRYTGHR